MRKLLLSIAMAIGCMAAHAQTDMTHRIANPSFESGNFDGWTNDGMAAQSNTSFGLKVGKVYAEKWTGKGNGVGSASIKQSIANLPSGTYTLSIVAQNIQQDTPNATQTGVSLVANSDATAVGVAGTYSVSTNVADGQLNIGFVLKNATGNYVCVDNFKLTLDACTAEQLAALVTDALPLTEQKMNATVQAELQAAVQAAQTQTGTDGITDVAAKLSDCLLAAKSSIDAYSVLKKVIDEASDYLSTSPQNGADELKAAFDEAQSQYDAATLDGVGCEAAAATLAGALITCRVANATGAAPKVTSEHFMPIGCIAALGRMTATGTNIIERGYVWAKHPNPTVADYRSTLKYENNGDIYELSPLEPATEYYVRAYAMTKTYAVSYGEEQRIFTLPKATCRWSYDEAGDAATNDRIRNAVRDACDFYNTWTSIPGFHLNAHYVPGSGAGGGTADCSYGGYMRVSQTVSYQRTGTLLHESNHGVGVGTSARWKNWDGSGLRTDGERGDWLGWRATQMVRFFDHNNTSTLHGDGTHMWPYGINGAHEDDNRKISYIANTLITHAVHQDGLAAVDGIGASPAYTFEYEDGKSYFITNEDASCNAGGLAYLYETATGTLKWGEASAEDISDDSSFAWQFEYVPEKAMYRIRNAKSGKYFTYSGSTIKTATKSKPGTSENFQLMIGNPEITVGLDKTITRHGYWIMAGTGNFQPYTLAATSTKGTKGEQLGHFSPLNASKQRWIILTAEEAKPLAGASADEHIDRLRKLVAGAKEMVDVPHTDKKEGATSAMQTLIADMESKAETIKGIAEAKEAVSEMEAGIRAFIGVAYPAEISQPYNLTCLICEPAFESTDSWSFNDLAVPAFANGVGQSSAAKFKLSQTLSDMAAGIYELRVQAFHQPSANNNVYIYGNSVLNKTVVAVFDESITNNDEDLSAYFANGAHDNSVVFKQTKAGDLTVGVANNNTKFDEGDITAFTNFRLYYFGNDVKKDEVVVINDITDASNTSAAIYDLMGRRVVAPVKGIYVQGGKKFIVK